MDGHSLLEVNVNAQIGSAGGWIMVVEGIEKRLGEETPVEGLGVQVRRHEGAVGEAGFDVELIADAVEVCLAAGGLGGLFAIGEPFGMFGFEIIVRIAEEKFGGGDKFGIVVAEAEHAAFVGRRGHGVNVVVVGKARVGVIVVDGDGVNFAEEAIVDFGK